MLLSRRLLLICGLSMGAGLAGDVRSQPTDLRDQFFTYPVVRSATLQGIRGAVVGRSEELFLSDASGGIYAMDPVTWRLRAVPGLPLLSQPGQLASGDGRVLVGTDLVLADWNTTLSSTCCDGRMLRIDPATGSSTVLASGNPQYSSPGDPCGVALGPGGVWDDVLFVMDFQGASSNAPVLYTVDENKVASTFLVAPTQWTPTTSPCRIAFAPAGGAFGGDLFVADPTTGIWRVTPTGGLSLFLAETGVFALAFGPGGAFGDELYYLDTLGPKATLLRVDATGRTSLITDEAGPNGVGGITGGDLAFASDGAALYVGSGNRVTMVVAATMTHSYRPQPVAAGAILDISTVGGPPAGISLWLADQVNGIPGLIPLGFVPFDPTGAWRLPYLVPPGLSGLSVRTQVLSVNAAGDLIVSNKDTMTFL